MFGSNFRDFVSQDTTSQGQSNSERLIKSWHGFEKPDSEDSGIEEEFEVLDSESQEIPATPCSTPPEDLSLENAILANFPDGCDRSFTVELKDEDSYGIIPKNLTFAEIINILNQAIQEDNCEELDKVVQNIEDYEGRSITLDNENLKDFCSNQLNLELQNGSNHQHIYSNVLSQYKFDQEGFKYDYSVKELVLLAIAANDKLVEQYQDFLFAEGNLSLLPLLVGGQKYIEAFIEKFHGTDGVYGRLKDQTIQLVEPNKIGFFSVIALRKEQELLNAVFVEYVLRDFGQVLKTSNPDSLYGVLETASLIKNEEFITIVLGAFERYINKLTKKASTEELLKKSFVTLLETAISQEHTSVIEYLCKRYTNSADHAIYDVYEQAFADDKVITILGQQILKNIGARGRKEIYDLILKTALDAGNIAFIEHLCEKCAKCSNDVIGYLNQKFKNNEFDEIYESILIALSNTESQDIIVSVLAHVQVCQSILSNKQQVFRQTIQNILRNAIKEASYGVVVPLCQHVDLKFAALQAICKEEFEKALPVVAEQLEKISMELSPSMTRNEYQKNRDTLSHLYLIRNLLESSKLINTSSKANIQTQANTQVNKRSSSDNAVSPVIKGDTAVVNEENNNQPSSQRHPKSKSAGSQQTEKNVLAGEEENAILNNTGVSTQEPLINNFEEGEIKKGSGKKGVKQLASPVKKKIDGLIRKTSTNSREELENILKSNSPTLVLQYVKNKEGPFKDKVVAFLTPKKNKKNGAKINGKQSTNPSNTVPPVQPTTPETPNASSSENKISEQKDGTQTTTKQQEDNTHSPQPIRVLGSFGYTSLKVAHERNITVKTRNVQNLQSAVLSSQQLASRNIIEIFNKHGREDFTPLTPTPAPTPQPTPALKPTLIPSVANNKSEQVNDTKTNGKLPNNPGNGSITATQNTQKSKWPTIATWTLAVAGVVSGVAIAVYLEMLAAGIAVGACCLVAAAVIYCCTPKSQVENNKVDKPFNTKEASTTVSV